MLESLEYSFEHHFCEMSFLDPKTNGKSLPIEVSHSFVRLDCVGIMKICAYGAAANSKNNSSSKSKSSANSNSVPNCSRNAATAANGRHRRRTKGRTTNEEKAKGGGDEETMPMREEQQKRTEQRRCQNDVHIVAQAQLPEGRVLRTQTEAIRCGRRGGGRNANKFIYLFLPFNWSEIWNGIGKSDESRGKLSGFFGFYESRLENLK